MKRVTRVLPTPPQHWVGDGFPVRSLFSYRDLASEMSPFLLLDRAGPHDFPPTDSPRGVGQHPHRGFETVTIVYDGEVAHRDSSGSGGVIGKDEVQWMTAASGVLHEEFHSEDFTRRGGTLDMVQLWINLSAENKKASPRYQTLTRDRIPEAALPGDAGRVRVIAGEYQNVAGPAQTFSPMQVLDIRLNAGAEVTLPVTAEWNTGLVLLHGQLTVADSPVSENQLVLLSREGDSVHLSAATDSVVLWLSGEPISEPVYGRGPFVMNSPEEIAEAIDDFQSGGFGQI